MVRPFFLDRYSHYCVFDKGGEELEEGRLSTNPKAFQQRFGSAVACWIALEVGTHSPWVNQLPGSRVSFLPSSVTGT